MPTFRVDSTVSGGEWRMERGIVFNKRCHDCEKHVWIGWWWAVETATTYYTNGTKEVEQCYYCPDEWKKHNVP